MKNIKEKSKIAGRPAFVDFCSDYRRLFFYGVSATAIKTIVAAVIIFFPLTAWLSAGAMDRNMQQIINLTNDIRINLHLGLLSENSALDQAAIYKVDDMITNQYFAHTSPAKKGVAYWLKSVGYNFAVGGENLALGYDDPQDVVDAWVASKTHYANLINPDYRDIGVAQKYGLYDNEKTSLIAQYFGVEKKAFKTAKTVAASKGPAAGPSGKTSVSAPLSGKTPAIAAESSKVLGEEVIGAPVLINDHYFASRYLYVRYLPAGAAEAQTLFMISNIFCGLLSMILVVFLYLGIKGKKLDKLQIASALTLLSLLIFLIII